MPSQGIDTIASSASSAAATFSRGVKVPPENASESVAAA